MSKLANSHSIDGPMWCGCFFQTSPDEQHIRGLWCGPYRDSPAVDIWSACAQAEVLRFNVERDLADAIDVQVHVLEILEDL